jgi:hypothetical protein
MALTESSHDRRMFVSVPDFQTIPVTRQCGSRAIGHFLAHDF